LGIYSHGNRLRCIYFNGGIVSRTTARHCVTCGKKYYPKSYYSYPDFSWGTSDEDKLEYARFHSLGCQREWLNKNKEAFAHLVDNISQSVIQDDSNIEKG